MKLKEYITKLDKIMKDGYEDLNIIYAIDDEGNEFNEITYNPTVGVYVKDKHTYRRFKNDEDEFEPNAVCIN